MMDSLSEKEVDIMRSPTHSGPKRCGLAPYMQESVREGGAERLSLGGKLIG